MSGAAITFALNCQRYGVETPQCPRTSLEAWAAYTQRRAPQHYDTYYAPLISQLQGNPSSGVGGPLQIGEPGVAASAKAEPGVSYEREALFSAFVNWLNDVNALTRRASPRSVSLRL